MEHQINADESEPEICSINDNETTQCYDNVTADNTSIEAETLNE